MNKVKSVKELGYNLSNKEFISAMIFQLNHECPWYKRWFRKKSPSFSYIVHHTNIGIGFDIICDKCGKKKDITDYNNW